MEIEEIWKIWHMFFFQNDVGIISLFLLCHFNLIHVEGQLLSTHIELVYPGIVSLEWFV